MRLSVNYFDLKTSSLVGSGHVTRDAEGTYKLPLLANEPTTRLRLVRVSDNVPAQTLEARTHHTPDAKTLAALHVPENWDETYLSVALSHDPRRTPQYMIVLIATPKPLKSAEELIALVNKKQNDILGFRYVRSSVTPSLPSQVGGTTKKAA